MSKQKSAGAHRARAGASHSVGFRQAFAYWVRLGFISFGGPAAAIWVILAGASIGLVNVWLE